MLNYILLQAQQIQEEVQEQAQQVQEQTQEQASGGEGGFLKQLPLLGAIILIFYFFMIRPQRRRQKEQRDFFEKIKRGDQVVTIGGMHGKVCSVQNDTVTLEVDNKGAKIVFEKTAVSLEASKRYIKKA
ncbi:MAG: preprotein translocase subunit YajC [Cytophagales bacterium]|nr:preprotein translocase subunit YajC [Cytophagales bacterium]